MLITKLSVFHEVLNGSEAGLKLDQGEASGFSEKFLAEDFGFVHRALLLVVVIDRNHLILYIIRMFSSVSRVLRHQFSANFRTRNKKPNGER